ncbi:MAG: chorismate synthase [Anaerolineales bacterium]
MSTRLRYLTAGESHGPELVTILEGFPAGLLIAVDRINAELARRQRGYGAGPRMKLERDRVAVISGVMEGHTTGAPIAMRIQNLNHERWRGEAIDPLSTPRPGHADLTAALKYGYDDLRPSLERASARETAARVAVGALCKQLLAQFEVQVGGYVTEIGAVVADLSAIPLLQRPELAEQNDVRCPHPETAQRIHARIRQAIEGRDTLGGVIEVIAWGLPPGLGSHVHWDRRLDARLGAAALSVQAIKGVEIGPAFENARLQGTQVHDPIRLQDDVLIRPTDRCGGLEGGITTGQPLLVRAAMKPIATTLTPQDTVDLLSGKETPTQYERSDFCPVPRAVPILEAVIAFALADALIEKLGGDSLGEMRPRFAALRQASLKDLPMKGTPRTWWPHSGDQE